MKKILITRKLIKDCEDKASKIFDQILNGENPKPGSYRGRKNSEPENNRTTLLGSKNA